VPVEDRADPPEGSEEAAEPQTDTSEGEGGGGCCSSEGMWLGVSRALRGGELGGLWELVLPSVRAPHPPPLQTSPHLFAQMTA
jgi:hypothetical protein